MKFPLKQFVFAGGTFGGILFIVWWLWVVLFPESQMHQSLLLESLPGATWPLNPGEWGFGLLSWFFWGGITGLVFAWLLNAFSSKQ